MFKNVFKIGLLAGALALSCNAFAQDNTKAQYPQYGFGSNWSLGFDLGWGHHVGSGFAFKHGSNLGLYFNLEKELSPVWDFRMRAGAPGLLRGHDCDSTCGSYGKDPFDCYGSFTFGFKMGLIDLFKGYDPERKSNLYLAVDGGVELFGNEDKYGMFGLIADLGLGYSYKICEHSTLSLEADLNAVGDINSPFNLFNGSTRDYYTYVGVGYQYNFGPTAADLELIAQRAKLTQENFDNLNNEIARLNNEVATGKQLEKKLQNNITVLEDKLSEAERMLLLNGSKSDSLAKVIDQIKTDQLNYYALPFSILYAVDQWRVPADQMSKVKAIARVINDTEGARFKVVGFCDKSGSDAYNMKLSEKRANELKRLLVEKYGVAEDRIDIDYKGKGMPFGDVAFSVNRRASVYRVIE